MILYFILQLPQRYGVRIDMDRFFSAFSMRIEEKRVCLEPWTLGPGFRPRDTENTLAREDMITDDDLIDQEEIRRAKNLAWNKYAAHTAGHIPYAVCRTNGYPPLEPKPACDVMHESPEGARFSNLNCPYYLTSCPRQHTVVPREKKLWMPGIPPNAMDTKVRKV